MYTHDFMHRMYGLHVGHSFQCYNENIFMKHKGGVHISQILAWSKF